MRLNLSGCLVVCVGFALCLPAVPVRAAEPLNDILQQRFSQFFWQAEQYLPLNQALENMVSDACARVYAEDGAQMVGICQEKVWHTMHWDEAEDEACADSGVIPSRLAVCTNAVEAMLRHEKEGPAAGFLLSLAYADEMCDGRLLCANGDCAAATTGR